jgi:hypothetical protein
LINKNFEKYPEIKAEVMDKLKELNSNLSEKNVRQQYVYIRDAFGSFMIALKKKHKDKKITNNEWFTSHKKIFLYYGVDGKEFMYMQRLKIWGDVSHKDKCLVFFKFTSQNFLNRNYSKLVQMLLNNDSVVMDPFKPSRQMEFWEYLQLKSIFIYSYGSLYREGKFTKRYMSEASLYDKINTESSQLCLDLISDDRCDIFSKPNKGLLFFMEN